jgi:glycosyltransferase involved in cell wall biosynthesis
MRIVIDLQGAQTESRFRGIGRYSLSLAKAIVANKGRHEVFLVLNGLIPGTVEPIRAAFDGLLPQVNIRVWYAPSPIRECNPENRHAREVAAYIRESSIKQLQPDVVFVSSLIEGYIDDAVATVKLYDQSTPVATMLYDLIPLVDAKSYLDSNPLYKAHYLQKISELKKSDLLFAISSFTKNEGVEYLGVAEDRVVNISTAIGEEFKVLEVDGKNKAEFLERFGIVRPFVLYTGGADKRKNLLSLIQAYAKLDASLRVGHQLVFAGKMPDSEIANYHREATQSGLASDELLILGYVTDADLILLYNLCALFVFPSLHEGFGIPALEAMSCGAAVIASNTTSIPEVVGNEEALFDPFSVEQIQQKITAVLSDHSLRARLVEQGLSRTKLFSWDRTARAVITEFEARFEPSTDAVIDRENGAVGGTDQAISQLIAKMGSLKFLSEEFMDFASIAQSIDLSHPEKYHIKQLLVDISELLKHDGKSGIQRVVRSIIQEWVVNPPLGFTIAPVYTKPNEFGYRYANQFIHSTLSREGEVPSDDPVAYRPGDVFLGLDLLLDVLPKQRSYYEAMREHGVTVYFVVYDLLLINFAHCFVDGLKYHYDQWLNTLVHFDGAICISETVAEELKEWMAIHGPERSRPFSVGWFHLGADINQSMPSKGLPENPEQRIEVLADNPNFLMVGTLEPRKGHVQTLNAFEVLWSQGVNVNLIIVGKKGWLVEALVERLDKHPESGKRLLWLDGVSDEYLEHVYNNSTCLIAASEGEGFGLPLIEAAQHGLPILARDIPVFREVAGASAHFFSGHSAENLADEIKVWLELYALNKHPSSVEMPWLTWKESAGQLVGVINKLSN